MSAPALTDRSTIQLHQLSITTKVRDATPSGTRTQLGESYVLRGNKITAFEIPMPRRWKAP
jgi:hypothetical protein